MNHYIYNVKSQYKLGPGQRESLQELNLTDE